MALLSKFFADKTPMPVVRVDDTCGHPQTRVVREHARKGAWQQIRDMLFDENDTTLRARYIAVAISQEKSDDWIDAWVEAEPNSGEAWLVKGDRSINRAWEIRGNARADETPQERWEPFHAKLDEATEQLFKAIDIHPRDPLPWARLLPTMMALGAPLEDRLAAFEESRRRDPSFVGAHTSAVMALSEKWGGSHDLMFNVARQSAENAPPRTIVALALAYAHIERWLYIANWEDDAKAAAGYFARPSVRDEIHACRERCGDAPPALQPLVSNTLSVCFYLGGDRKAAKQEFRNANGLTYTSSPWRYLGESAYGRAVQECW